MKKLKTAILGATGYTGVELLRLLVSHPCVDIVTLTSEKEAGEEFSTSFPQAFGLNLPKLIPLNSVDWQALDIVFCALPHGTTQETLSQAMVANPKLKIIDLSADFRLSNPAAYEKWYGHPHTALHLQENAVYGLCEVYRKALQSAQIVANPGCYTTTALLPLIPLLRERLITPDIIIDAKSGVTGAGRSAKRDMLYAEVSEGFHAYGVAHHRHMAELDEQLSKAAGEEVVSTFTPHLVPMLRGIYATIYITLRHKSAQEVHAVLSETYGSEPFVKVLPYGEIPHSRHVRGSNRVHIGLKQDRTAQKAILISTSDNLLKGASGQAVQNFNIINGFEETLGLPMMGMYP